MSRFDAHSTVPGNRRTGPELDDFLARTQRTFGRTFPAPCILVASFSQELSALAGWLAGWLAG
jgi:hypothetical protein